MQRKKKRSRRLVRLSLALSLSLCFAVSGCAHRGGVADRRCPEPTQAETEDWDEIVAEAPDRPAVRWVARVIGYCWPEEADEVRGEG